jgi:hypothetical protein
MPEIKMFRVSREFNWGTDEVEAVVTGCTDWDEVTEKQFEQLLEWTRYKNTNTSSLLYILVEKPGITIATMISEYLEFAKKDLEQKKKRKAAAAKRKATLAAKKKESSGG